MRKLALLIALVLPLPLAAQVYKYTDEKGVVHYTDKAPAKGAKPANLPPLHTYAPVSAPEGSEAGGSTPAGAKPKAKAESAAVAGDFELRIVSPVQNQTARDASGTLAVSVEVSPGIPDGYRLVYYVDGSPNGEPTVSTSTTLSGVERGEHNLTVGLLDPEGKEVAQSAPVTVYLRQPTVKNPVGTRPPRPAPR
ncbi:DUF4124 domain-containing protein [Solimonas sp. SE-A11]|uniref:DUF4124 domain-containing protein n=1 Tax=Solimonas sp. SE-A11 TaxID=3054954 RepID=UPI00259C914E|nr:DUF4124 domain-containing protein [Solimonas sp. SE-A11]MDM4771803.1 DUF4124 domain-containing protein [Solimonas sp. SE-A11]